MLHNSNKIINGAAPVTYAECYDLQTGQIYYDILYYTNVGGTGVTPTNFSHTGQEQTLQFQEQQQTQLTA